MQPFPPPNGHWGTPFRIYKEGGSAGSPIMLGDSIYFDRMISGTFDTNAAVMCDTSKCGGTTMADKTVFKISAFGGRWEACVRELGLIYVA